MPKAFLLNLSGHPVPKKKVDGRIVVSIPVQLSLSGGFEDIKKEVYDMLERIWAACDADVQKAAAAGRVALILPGLSWFAACVLAAWHAISGHFPKIYFFIRGTEGFELVGPIDLQDIRDRWRWDRPYFIK